MIICVKHFLGVEHVISLLFYCWITYFSFVVPMFDTCSYKLILYVTSKSMARVKLVSSTIEYCNMMLDITSGSITSIAIT